MTNKDNTLVGSVHFCLFKTTLSLDQLQLGHLIGHLRDHSGHPARTELELEQRVVQHALIGKA